MLSHRLLRAAAIAVVLAPLAACGAPLSANPWVLEGESGPGACGIDLNGDSTFRYHCRTYVIEGTWQANTNSIEFHPTDGSHGFSCEFTLDGTRLEFRNCPIQYRFEAAPSQ